MLLTLFLATTATFFLMHAIPGEPFEISRETPDSVKEAMYAKYGLDTPIWVTAVRAAPAMAVSR